MNAINSKQSWADKHGIRLFQISLIIIGAIILSWVVYTMIPLLEDMEEMKQDALFNVSQTTKDDCGRLNITLAISDNLLDRELYDKTLQKIQELECK